MIDVPYRKYSPQIIASGLKSAFPRYGSCSRTAQDPAVSILPMRDSVIRRPETDQLIDLERTFVSSQGALFYMTIPKAGTDWYIIILTALT